MSDSRFDDAEELATFHLLGWLDSSKSERYTALLERDERANDVLRSATESFRLLAEMAPTEQPPTRLRERLLGRLETEPQRRSGTSPHIEVSPGLVLVFAERLDWQETGVPGVRVKRLYLDEARQYASNLVSMVAGSVYPRHWHQQVEELLMLQGNIRVSGYRLGPGDYCRAEAGTVHDEVVADTDCVFLALAALGNEIRP